MILLCGKAFQVTLNPPGQYADDRHLRARQRFWLHQDPPLDVVNWVLDRAGLAPGQRVLDAGCGNGLYLRALRDLIEQAVGVATPGWRMRPATAAFTAENAAGQLGQDETARPWADVVADVRRRVQAVIDEQGAFVTAGDLAAFLCR
jgi:SAM-dependent methyltransferase